MIKLEKICEPQGSQWSYMFVFVSEFKFLKRRTTCQDNALDFRFKHLKILSKIKITFKNCVDTNVV